MKRQRTAGFLVILLTLLVPAVGLGQAAIKLAYKFTRGQPMVQVSDARAEGQLTVEENGKQKLLVPLALKANSTFSARVTQVRPDGTATLKGSLVSMSVDCKQGDHAGSTRAKDGKVMMTADGEEMPDPATARNLFRPITFRLTSLGIGPDDKEPGSLGFVKIDVAEVKPDTLVLATALAGDLAWVLPLPDNPIKVGDSWSQKAKASLPNDQIAEGAITYALLGFERVGGEQVARIGIKGSAKASSVSLTVAGEAGNPDTTGKVTVDEFTQEIEGTATFLVNKGRLGKVDLTMRMHEVISQPKPTGKKTATITATGKMTLTEKS